MKIEVFSQCYMLQKHEGTKALPAKKVISWSWRSKVNGRTTAHATGYNRKSDAIRAAVNHGMAFVRLSRAIRSHESYLTVMRGRIRAAIKVIE